MQVGVTVGRVRVYPGDIVFGDELGIVVLAQKVWETVAQAAEQIQRSEEQRLAEYIVAQRGAGSPTTQKPEEV
jgi:regulator of RNase E activity RraA